MPSIYLWSDTHFHHDNVIRFCERPFKDLPEMHTALIENYRKTVRSSNDIVYFLGDIFFGNYEDSKEVMQHLPGRKRLVQGNHDKFSQQQYASLGFEIVVEEAMIRAFGRRLRLCHYPRRPNWWRRLWKKEKINYLDRRPPNDGRWLLHGHTHSKEKICVKRKMIHVGVDAWNFTPTKLGQVESMIAKAESGRPRAISIP